MRGSSDNSDVPNGDRPKAGLSAHPFRRAVLRGLAVLLPPLLTIVVLLLVWNTILIYVLEPIEGMARHTLVWYWSGDVLDGVPDDATDKHVRTIGDQQRVAFKYGGNGYVLLDNGQAIRTEVFDAVSGNPGQEDPRTAEAYYHRYVKIKWLQRQYVIPFLLGVFILVCYLLGKVLAAGLGRFVWVSTEQQILNRLPIIRHVYSSAKQVTDFFLSEREIEYTRVVAVEYPRRGIWSLGFVTGESMLDIGSAANEPVVSVIIPNSPMPATGFTITVRRSEVIDLNVTVDQAVQFIVSCGVVVPPQQHYTVVGSRIAPAIADRISAPGDTTSALPAPSQSGSSGESS
jgi:uncharacterized membrane protein